MHFHKVTHILGLLLICLSAFMLLPVPFSLYYGESDAPAFLISAAISFVVGLIAYKATRLDGDLRPKEDFAIVTFAWLTLSFFGSLPFVLSGAIPSETDAFFETISGFTTTGASILTDIEHLPHGILFWRSLTHWIGGMGIIVLSLVILPFLGISGMPLFKAEIPGPVADKLAPRITETAKILWGVYMLFTVVETFLLMLGGLSFFDAICHTFGTMATGGYSTRNASVGAYHSLYLDSVITFFMLLAGTNFALHYRFLKGDFRAYIRNHEFLFFIGLIGVVTLFLCFDTFFVYDRDPVATLQKTLFQVASILTTTGYATADYEQWSPSSEFALLVLMMVGGCAGSTSGGIKIMRIHLLAKFVLSELRRHLHPQAVIPVRMNGVPVPKEVVTNVLGYFIFFILLFLLGVLAMSLLGLDMLSAFGAVAATLGNVGPGLGSVGPTDNYAHLPAAGKWLLSFFMLLGRLEIFTVIVLFSPDAWRK
jgi:trk system potassium uptake protein TrkH